jgi:hypothetical protein
MPITVQTDESKDLTTFQATGVLTLEEQLAALRPFYEGNPTKNVLFDLRAITGNRVSSSELEQIADLMARYKDKRPQGKTALLVSGKADYGLGRMVSIMAETKEVPVQVQVFYSIDEAMEWLGSTSPVFCQY